LAVIMQATCALAVLVLVHFPVAVAALARPKAPSPAIVRLERAARELSTTFVYEGLVRACDPLDLFVDDAHQGFWFEASKSVVEADLASATIDKTYETAKEVPVKPAEVESASPLLAARAKRAQKTKRFVTAAPLQTAAPVPEGAEAVGPEESASDHRTSASKALVQRKLTQLQARRNDLDAAVDEMLDPLVAPDLPAFDVAVLLLFLVEIENGLPVPVACKEAAMLQAAYSGDASSEQKSVRHVQGVLNSYATERLGLRAGRSAP